MPSTEKCTSMAISENVSKYATPREHGAFRELVNTTGGGVHMDSSWLTQTHLKVSCFSLDLKKRPRPQVTTVSIVTRPQDKLHLIVQCECRVRLDPITQFHKQYSGLHHYL